MDKSASYALITKSITVGGRVFDIGDVIEVYGSLSNPHHPFIRDGHSFWLFYDGSYRLDGQSTLDCWIMGQSIWELVSPLEALAMAGE